MSGGPNSLSNSLPNSLPNAVPNARSMSHDAAEPTSRSIQKIAAQLGMDESAFIGGDSEVRSPIDGEVIGSVTTASTEQLDRALDRAVQASRIWRTVPAPRRGELVRRLGDELRRHKQALGDLVTLEVGKVTSEGRGEVQEMIDVCDFAVGLSRQLYGATMTSERAGHRLMEQWHPIGPVGIVTAFNFPVAVWAWNAALALVCGDPVVWKPSEKAPLCALACQAILEQRHRGSRAGPRELRFLRWAELDHPRRPGDRFGTRR